MSFGERFLGFPDLFPARQAGESWGDRHILLDLPGGPYLAAGLSTAQAAAAGERFGEIVRPAGGGESSVETRLFAVAPEEFLAIDTRGWEYSLDFDHQPDSVRLAGLRLMARIDWAADPARSVTAALWTSEDGGAAGDLFPGIFENFLRVVVAYRLLELGGLVVHSAGVVDGDAAYLFLGRSGAGKTTLSRLSEAAGRTVLSDDLNALLPAAAGGGLQVEKLPFTGDLGDRRRGAPPFPLAALLRLEKAPEDSLRELSTAGAAGQLLACSPFVNVDPHRRERVAEIAAGLARRAPAAVLAFSLSGGLWSILTRDVK